jgi:hypothetical protein
MNIAKQFGTGGGSSTYNNVDKEEKLGLLKNVDVDGRDVCDSDNDLSNSKKKLNFPGESKEFSNNLKKKNLFSTPDKTSNSKFVSNVGKKVKNKNSDELKINSNKSYFSGDKNLRKNSKNKNLKLVDTKNEVLLVDSENNSENYSEEVEDVEIESVDEIESDEEYDSNKDKNELEDLKNNAELPLEDLMKKIYGKNYKKILEKYQYGVGKKVNSSLNYFKEEDQEDGEEDVYELNANIINKKGYFDNSKDEDDYVNLNDLKDVDEIRSDEEFNPEDVCLINILYYF